MKKLVQLPQNNKQKRMDMKMKYKSQLGSFVPVRRFMQLCLTVFMTGCVIEAAYAGSCETNVVVTVDEKKEVSKSSDVVTKGDGAEIVVNQTLVEILSDTIREALRQPAFKMRNRAFSHATFPSWQKFEGGAAYSASEYICIWRKKPLLDIEADKSRWISILGSGYEARAKGLAKSRLRYIHSLSIYKKGNFVGDVPIPSVVLMLEKSNHIKHLNICAFTPDGHRNFGDADFLSDDKAFLMNVFAAASIAVGDTPSKIGDVDAGIKAMRNDLGTAMIGRPQKEEHTKAEHGFVASGVFGDSLSCGLVAGFTFATDTSDFVHPERLFRIAHESSRKPLVSNGVLPLNGCYSGPMNTTTDVAIPELRYDRFSVAVSFKPDFDGVRYGMPLISFGGGWRWFHVFLNKDGNVDISFRGLFARDVIHFTLKDKFSKNGWNSFVVTFDFDSRRLVAALNHGERAEFDLPNDFAYRFQSDDWDRCRSVQFANLNNGSVFKGEIDSLLLYNRPLSWNEMQQFFGRKILKELFNPGLWGGKSMAMMPSVANRQGSGSNWRIEATDEACFYWNGRLSDGRWALDARLDGHGISVGLERPRGDGVLDLRKPVLDGTGRTVPIVGIGLDDMKLSHVGVSHSAPIESVNLPDTLIWLGPGALEDCDRLTSVKLPQSLRRIGSCAFSGCSNLNRIEIPTDVEFLSRDRVFMGCSSLEEIVVQSEKAGYKTEDGVLFSSDGKILVAYPGGRRGPYRVPKGVKRISERAFLGCSRLTELYIPASVREIEDYALAGCKGLKHIEFEDSSFDLNQDRVFGRSYPGRPSVSRPTTNLQSNHMPRGRSFNRQTK